MCMSISRCSDCGKLFSQNHALVVHENQADCSQFSPCEGCGKVVKSKFCSPECSEDSCVCPYCDKEYSTPQALGSHKGQAHEDEMEKQKTAVCDGCGEEFEKVPSQDRRFCSYDCRAEWQAEAFQDEGGPAWEGGKSTWECEWCEDVFEQYESQGSTRFCSKSCYWNWLAENMPTGPNHYSWKGGYDRDYGDGWNEAKRKAVRKKCGFECYLCGMTQEEHKSEFRAVLPVHHIVPYRRMESDSEANDMENLVALCAECHMDCEREIWKKEDVRGGRLSDKEYRQIIGTG